MLKKIVFGLLTALLALSLVGCGGGNDKDGNKDGDSSKKEETASNASLYPADEAVLYFAKAGTFVDMDSCEALGMTDTEIEGIYNKIIAPSVAGFKGLNLNDENAEALTDRYFAYLDENMNISTQIIKDDPEHPVVQITATPLDPALIKEYMATCEPLQTVQLGIQQLTQSGLTADAMRNDEDFQRNVMSYMEQYIDGIPLSAEGPQTFEVKCKLETNSNGDKIWMPEDPEGIAKFLTGQQ